MATADELQNLLERLSRIPERIGQATDNWTTGELRRAPSAEDWSAADILAHLRASDAILAYRVYCMLVRDNPPLPAYDDRDWARTAGYAAMDFRASLQLFALQRAELTAMLRGISPEDWQRSGVHEQRGTISILDTVRWLVEHEEEHCAQLEAIGQLPA